jgi:hypothetical protein
VLTCLRADTAMQEGLSEEHHCCLEFVLGMLRRLLLWCVREAAACVGTGPVM